MTPDSPGGAPGGRPPSQDSPLRRRMLDLLIFCAEHGKVANGTTGAIDLLESYDFYVRAVAPPSPAGAPPQNEELDEDAYPIVTAAIGAAETAVIAWNDWLASDAPEAEGKAQEAHVAMQALAKALLAFHDTIDAWRAARPPEAGLTE